MDATKQASEPAKLTAWDVLPTVLDHPAELTHALADLVNRHTAARVVDALAGILAGKYPDLAAKLRG